MHRINYINHREWLSRNKTMRMSRGRRRIETESHSTGSPVEVDPHEKEQINILFYFTISIRIV